MTATQLGYALGIFLFVPLGDLVNRRFLVPLALLSSTAALVICAVSPTFPVLLAALSLVGLTTVSGQILVPLAGDLAEPSGDGRRPAEQPEGGAEGEQLGGAERGRQQQPDKPDVHLSQDLRDRGAHPVSPR